MKFIAVQTGARRGYAAPAILEQAGMLERFYTDVCGSVGMGAVAARLRHVPIVSLPLRRLHARRIPPAVAAKTRTFSGPVVRRTFDGWRLNDAAAAAFRRHTEFTRRWGDAMVRAGFGQATHVFSMLGEGGPFLTEAKRRGLTVVSEVYILLSTLRIVAAEQRAFPGWEPPSDPAVMAAIEADTQLGLVASSDYFICPSPAVQADLVANWGVDADRTAVVPYGVHSRWLEMEPRPTPGRVLFVGTGGLRKGIHYLARAAELLAAAGDKLEFRVAGRVAPQIAARPECRAFNFLGSVPRERIHEEFQLADVFVLPSLAEGSAESTYEALAAGLPVVTTAASGSVVRDGVEGRVVPERDAESLAAALVELVADRDKRNRMAAAARERARDYTWERYGERLIAALRRWG